LFDPCCGKTLATRRRAEGFEGCKQMVEQVVGVGGGEGVMMIKVHSFIYYLHSGICVHFVVPSFCSEPSREKQVKLPAHGKQRMCNGPEARTAESGHCWTLTAM
jgi:hypothetical protein